MKRTLPFRINIMLTFLLLVLMGCSPLEQCKVVKVNSLKIAESKGFGVTIKTDLELLNPNHRSMKIRNSDIDVYIEGTYIGKLIIPENLEIPSNKNFLAHLSIDVSFNNMLIAGKNVLKKISSGSFELSLKGKLQVHYLFFNNELLVDTTNKVEL